MFQQFRPVQLATVRRADPQRAELPAFRLRTLGGASWCSHDPAAGLRLLLVYRGVHSEACRQRVQELARLAERLQQWGVCPIAVSADPRIRAEAAHCLWRLDELCGGARLELGYGLPLDAALHCALPFAPGVGRADNGWMEPPLYVLPGVFLLDGAGRVLAALRDAERLDRGPLLELMPALPLLVQQAGRSALV